MDGPTEDAGFVWVHFNLAHRARGEWLRRHVVVSEVFDEAPRDRARSTRVEMDDAMLVAIINDVHDAFAYEPTDIATMWLLVRPRLVVSAGVDLLVRLLRAQADVLAAIVRETTQRVDEIEDHLLQRPPDWISLADLQELRESTEEFHRVLSDRGVGGEQPHAVRADDRDRAGRPVYLPGTGASRPAAR